MSRYIDYYDNQVGQGNFEKYNRFGRVFVGTPYQRGHGIGSFLGGLFRRALPYLKSGARAVAQEALDAGVNVIGDVTRRNVSMKDALESRLSESGLRLKRKAQDKISELMKGSGYKRSMKKRRAHSHTTRVHRRSSNIRKKFLVKRGRKQLKGRKSQRRPVKKSTGKRRKSIASRKKRDINDIFGAN